jgi:hypothetical protein
MRLTAGERSRLSERPLIRAADRDNADDYIRFVAIRVDANV